MFRVTRNLAAVSKSATQLPELNACLKSDAMSEFMSKKQIDLHWDKHHRAYFNNLAGLLKDAPENVKNMDLVQLIAEAKKTGSKPLFNNAAQAINHNFFWDSISLKHKFDASKHSTIAKKMDADLGGYENVVKEISTQAKTHFGSGWAWLVLNKDKKLEVKNYHDADTPFAHGETPLLTIDVWEHAYYVDHENRRPNFVDSYFKNLANWNFAEENLKAAL